MGCHRKGADLVASHRLELTGLGDAKERCLMFQAERVDFVEEKCILPGRDELAEPARRPSTRSLEGDDCSGGSAATGPHWSGRFLSRASFLGWKLPVTSARTQSSAERARRPQRRKMSP